MDRELLQDSDAVNESFWDGLGVEFEAKYVFDFRVVPRACVSVHTLDMVPVMGGGTPSEGVSPPIKHPSDKDGQLVTVMGGGTLIWYPTGAFFMGYPTHERYRQSRGDGF